MNSTRTRRYWGTQRVARVCQVTPATVAHWIDQGHLKGHRTPTGHRRVDAEDLVEFLRNHGMQVPTELQAAERGDVVVVVEDDPGYRRVLQRALEAASLGVGVIAAPTGVDGLIEIGRVRPTVIVLDYTLPDLNAAQIVERLLAPGRGLDAEVVVVTAGLSSDDARWLHRLGVNVIVDKAAGIEAAVEAVAAALERRRTVRA